MALDTKPQAAEIALGPSRYLGAAVVLLCAGAMALSVVYLHPGVAVAVCGVLVWCGWRALQLHALRRCRDAIVALRLIDGGIACRFASGVWREGELLAGGLVGPLLTVFRWRESGASGRAVALVICPDALGRDDFRRLRVHLRWAASRTPTDTPTP